MEYGDVIIIIIIIIIIIEIACNIFVDGGGGSSTATHMFCIRPITCPLNSGPFTLERK
jgi:hypothetical protein